MGRNNIDAVAILPEIIWGGILSVLANNLTYSAWNDFANLVEIAILIVAAIWSLYRRFRESLSEVFWSVLYMASTIGLLAIQNSSWTRFAVLIIMAAYIYGRNFREKKRDKQQ